MKAEDEGKITYTVPYEKLVDGEHESENKDFTDRQKALDFAKEKYSYVLYEKETGETGYVDVTTGELLPNKKR